MKNTINLGVNRTGRDMALASAESASGSALPPDDAPGLTESVAGEEDPGASIDVTPASAVGSSDQPAGRAGDEPTTAQVPMSPGDEAPPGTPGTGEDVCPRCGGSGKVAGGDCPDCQGTGKVTVGIGGA